MAAGKACSGTLTRVNLYSEHRPHDCHTQDHCAFRPGTGEERARPGWVACAGTGTRSARFSDVLGACRSAKPGSDSGVEEGVAFEGIDSRRFFRWSTGAGRSEERRV